LAQKRGGFFHGVFYGFFPRAPHILRGSPKSEGDTTEREIPLFLKTPPKVKTPECGGVKIFWGIFGLQKGGFIKFRGFVGGAFAQKPFKLPPLNTKFWGGLKRVWNYLGRFLLNGAKAIRLNFFSPEPGWMNLLLKYLWNSTYATKDILAKRDGWGMRL